MLRRNFLKGCLVAAAAPAIVRAASLMPVSLTRSGILLDRLSNDALVRSSQNLILPRDAWAGDMLTVFNIGSKPITIEAGARLMIVPSQGIAMPIFTGKEWFVMR